MSFKTNRKCDDCLKITKRSWRYKGSFYCYLCYRKRCKMMDNPLGSKPYFNLEQALNRVYEVKGYMSNENKILARLHLPQILTGHKVRLVLVK